MKTVIVQVPDQDGELFSALVAKLDYQARLISKTEKEEIALAHWIDEGMKSKEVSTETVYTTLRKCGVKI